MSKQTISRSGYVVLDRRGDIAGSGFGTYWDAHDWATINGFDSFTVSWTA